MMRRRTPDHVFGPLTWRLACCLVLLMLLGRFALPAGFMPVTAGTHGEFVLSLCSGRMPPPLVTGEDHGGFDDSDMVAGCPFGLLAMQTVMPEPGIRLVTVAFRFAALPLPAFRAVPSLPATGPPLGPRAPPSILS